MYLTCKKLYLVVKCFSFAEKENAMNNMNFEHICTLICWGELESALTFTEDDNVFYDELGMSCVELAELVAAMRC